MISSATPESTLKLSSLAPTQPAEVLQRNALERDVLVLFDRFRDPLLRYVCACGIAVGDGEDLALKRRAQQQREAARLEFDPHPALSVIDPNLDPELRLVDQERRHRLRSVLNALPERERQCLHLRHGGLRYRDIAAVLGISLGAVAKSVARAIARLERVDQK